MPRLFDGDQYGHHSGRYAGMSRYLGRLRRGYSQLKLMIGLIVLALILAIFVPRTLVLLEEAQRLQVLAMASRFRAVILTLRASWWAQADRPSWLILPLVDLYSAVDTGAGRIRPNTTVAVAKSQQQALDNWPKASKLDAVRMSPAGWPIDWQLLEHTGVNSTWPDQLATSANREPGLSPQSCLHVWQGLLADAPVMEGWLVDLGVSSVVRVQHVLADQQGCLYLLAVDNLPLPSVKSGATQPIAAGSVELAKVGEAWLQQSGKQSFLHYSVHTGRISWQFR